MTNSTKAPSKKKKNPIINKGEISFEQLRRIKEEGLTVAQVTGRAPMSQVSPASVFERDLSDALSVSKIKDAFNEIEKEEAAYVNRILDELDEEEEEFFNQGLKVLNKEKWMAKAEAHGQTLQEFFDAKMEHYAPHGFSAERVEIQLSLGHITSNAQILIDYAVASLGYKTLEVRNNQTLEETYQDMLKEVMDETSEVVTLPSKIIPVEDVNEPVIVDLPRMEDDIQLTPSQQKVLDKVKDWYISTPGYGVFQLGGYAGVGKSTVVKQILQELPVRYSEVSLCAPTGTAALVLADKTPGYDFSTNHGLFYELSEGFEGQAVFTRTSSKLFGKRLVIMDEASMSGSLSGTDILDMCRQAKVKILVVGDPGQLEPVNDGDEFFLLEPDAMLTEVMRQAADNPIIKLSMKIREATDSGHAYIIPKNKNWNVDNKVFLRPRSSVSIAMMARVITKGGAIICGKNDTRKAYNKMIRRELGFTADHLMEGEMVVVKENIRGTDENIPITNGMRGTATRITRPKEGMVRFTFTPEMFGGSREIECNENLLFEHISFKEFQNNNRQLKSKGYTEIDAGISCRLGYVITGHGSQGSQWPVVFVFDESTAFGWKDPVKGYISRNRWLYTVVTRASEQLMILS